MLALVRGLWLAPFLIMTLSSCTTFKDQRASKEPSAQKPPSTDFDISHRFPMDSPKIEKSEIETSETTDIERIEQLTIGDVITVEEPDSHTEYDNSRYDFPITVNSKVEGWVDYFTGKGRRHFERYLARSYRYTPPMKKIFRESNLPEDLVYLAMVESGFNLQARSRASAVGPWQFMKATGRRYGLTINAWVDERRDPIKATVAAAKYLKDLYLIFESWYLVTAAYNAGEFKILRAIKTLNTHNFWAIAKTRRIRRETKDHVPKIIAAAIISKNPERYDFEDVTQMEPFKFDTVTAPFAMRLTDLAKYLNADFRVLKDLNPELINNIVPPGATDYQLRVPYGSKALVERTLVAKRTELSKPVLPFKYTVRRGDSLYRIARRFGVTIRELAQTNNIRISKTIYPGMKLMVPKLGKTLKKRRVAANSKKGYRRKSKQAGKKGFVTHIVRKGESLWSIAIRYNVTIQKLFRWNNLKSSRIHPGRRLLVKPINRANLIILKGNMAFA